MEKLPMCRICLVQNVRMSVVVNRDLRVLYEKLTELPFVTEDSRPIVACFFCCAKLKQCYRLLRQCLKAEELFTQMMNGDYEANALINQDHKKVFNWFIKTPTENISIVDECQTESVAIKEELPAVCEGLDIIIEPKEEHLSDELEQENVHNSCLDVADTQPPQSKSDLEDDMPLTKNKIDVKEEQEVSKEKQNVRETTSTTVVKKPKLEERRTKVEDTITAEQVRKDKSDTKVIRTVLKRAPAAEKPKLDKRRIKTEANKAGLKKIILSESEKPQNLTSKSGMSNRFSVKGTWRDRIHTDEKPYKCNVCQCCFNHKGHLTRHVLMHTGEKPNKCDICQRSFSQFGNLKRHFRIHIGEKPFKCDLCQRCFNDKRDLSKHIRIHNDEKPFQCDICQLRLNDKRDLIKHIRKHTGEKRFNCDKCQRSFNYSCDLKKHVRIHTGEKPYRCDVCQRSFSIMSNFKKHSRIHSDESF